MDDEKKPGPDLYPEVLSDERSAPDSLRFAAMRKALRLEVAS